MLLCALLQGVSPDLTLGDTIKRKLSSSQAVRYDIMGLTPSSHSFCIQFQVLRSGSDLINAGQGRATSSGKKGGSAKFFASDSEDDALPPRHGSMGQRSPQEDGQSSSEDSIESLGAEERRVDTFKSRQGSQEKQLQGWPGNQEENSPSSSYGSPRHKFAPRLG
jgi:hypothetical protein